jgi:protein-L-isoaspartate(D-aspartate) O-methyltransferase
MPVIEKPPLLCGVGRGRLTNVVLLLAAVPVLAQDYRAARENMVADQIESRGVRNAAVLKAMRSVERHLFVPAELRGLAHADRPLPVGHGATISQPYIVALMTELLEVSAKNRVLEIGTGSGYQAAILSQLAAEVSSIEIVPELAQSAAMLLEKSGYRNVTVRAGDGYLGWPERAPFDRIIVTAAPPKIPEALVEQLARGGRLVVPVGAGTGQELVVVEKKADGSITRRSVLPVRFVPMVPGR